jgi:hypothetical protein
MSRSIEPDRRDAPPIGPTDETPEHPARNARQPDCDALRRLIDRHAQDQPTFPEFLEHLKKAGVLAISSIQKSGRLNGISYVVDGLLIKGSDLGRAYTAHGLQRRKGLRYDALQHRQALEEAAMSAKDQVSERALLRQPDARRNEERRRTLGELSAAQKNAMLEIGRFRTILVEDFIRIHYRNDKAAWKQDAARLAALGLIEQRSVMVTTHSKEHGRQLRNLRVVVLTKKGKDLLRRYDKEAKPGIDGRPQALYAGLVKPREIAHDAAIYRMFQAEAARIEAAGGRVRRVVLDFELKKRVYSPLAKAQKQGPLEYAQAQTKVAQEHGLKVVGGKIRFPDLRVEYEDAHGAAGSVDLELATEHYRGDHMAAKGRAGFKIYADSRSIPRASGSFGRSPVHDVDYLHDIFTF